MKELEHLAYVEPAIDEMRVFLIKEPNRLLNKYREDKELHELKHLALLDELSV